MTLAWNPGTGPASLIILAVTAVVVLIAVVGLIAGNYLYEHVIDATRYHSQQAKHAARRRDNDPDRITEIAQAADYPTAFPAVPADQRPDGRPA